MRCMGLSSLVNQWTERMHESWISAQLGTLHIWQNGRRRRFDYKIA